MTVRELIDLLDEYAQDLVIVVPNAEEGPCAYVDAKEVRLMELTADADPDSGDDIFLAIIGIEP